MKKYLFIFLLFSAQAIAQERQVFSEQFMSNQHNWPTSSAKKGVKIDFDRNRGYDVNNRSDESFAVLIPVAMDTTKNYHIMFNYEDMSSLDKNFAVGKIFFMFGASDDNNGYTIEQADKFLSVSKLTNGVATELFKSNPPNIDKNKVNFRCIDGRWKFYKNAVEIADMPAQDLMGKLMGVRLNAGSHAALKSLTVTQWAR